MEDVPKRPTPPRKLVWLVDSLDRLQVRADHPAGSYRVVYVAQLGEAIYVLHAFQKKSKSGIATPRREPDLVRQRLQLARKLAGK